MSDPKNKDEVRIYNRGKRTFTHGEFVAAPASFATIPKEVAENWYRLFPNEVVDAGVAQKEIGGAQAEVATLRAELSKSREQLAASQARVEELLEQLHPKTKGKSEKDKI